MNKVFLSGRITSDISRFGTDSKGGVRFSLITSKPVIKDGQVQKDDNGSTETYDEFHTVKAFHGLVEWVANHKKKGDNLMVGGEIGNTRKAHDGPNNYNPDSDAEATEVHC